MNPDHDEEQPERRQSAAPNRPATAPTAASTAMRVEARTAIFHAGPCVLAQSSVPLPQEGLALKSKPNIPAHGIV